MPASTKKPLDQISVLLLQARNAREMERQEQQCFVERCRIPLSQFAPVNVAYDSVHPGLLDGMDALMIGGAGEYSACEDYPWMEAVLDLLRLAYERRLPTFGSCWGHQLIARAFGGTVIHDSERAEFGCGEIELTEAAREDPLFRPFPRSFRANLGHHDRVSVLPPNGVELAFNASQPNQAFRLDDAPIYGTQFHSELDARREKDRLLVYRDNYREELGGPEAFQRVLDSLEQTTEADHLLYDFLRTFVCDGPPPTNNVPS